MFTFKLHIYIVGECYHALGRLPEAIDSFNTVLNKNNRHFQAYFRRELAYYYWSRLDLPLKSFNSDFDIDPRLKLGLSKNGPWEETLPTNSYVSYREAVLAKEKTQKLPTVSKRLADSLPEAERNVIRAALNVTSFIASFIQLDTPGFLVNRRQHRQVFIHCLCKIVLTLYLLQHALTHAYTISLSLT